MKTFYFYVRQTTLPDMRQLLIVEAPDVWEAPKKIRLVYGDKFWTTMHVFGEGQIGVEVVMTPEEERAATEAGYDRYARGGN